MEIIKLITIQTLTLILAFSLVLAGIIYYAGYDTVPFFKILMEIL